MKVKDIMTNNVICVNLDTEISEIAKILTEKRIHGVPVVKNEKVVGIITETDFFVGNKHSLYLPSFIEFIKDFKISQKAPLTNKLEFHSIMKSKAEDIMTKRCVSVDPDMEIEDLLHVFKEEGFHTLPVIDKEGNLCGIVTLSDIISFINLQP